VSKEIYDRRSALEAADGHAAHFLNARLAQIQGLGDILDGPPVLFCPYDAELFGHWWHEGPEFLDFFVRKACRHQNVFSLSTPEAFLRRYPTHQVATPAASSWGEDGYWKAWLNEKNQWVHPHLHVAQRRMTELADHFPQPDALQHRALQQAARELLLAQASDWLFILHTGTSPDYATRRIKDHLLRFTTLYEQTISGAPNELGLAQVEAQDNLFPKLDWRYWR
jgi:1,4-alpha-glucan branching enzyme